ncbi:mitochondrial ribosomal protein L28-domain-containing protein [Hyaloraphidium curvatum]|nr:mitochondrial ribosomal protein L28-domain-containing protein [Hyaloraphidium curvatum]
MPLPRLIAARAAQRAALRGARIVEARAAYAADKDERRKRVMFGGDPRNELIRNTLYPPQAFPKPPEVAPEEAERRELIAKAWTIYRQHQTEQQLQALKAKFLSMRLAMRVLRRVNSRLFKGALTKSADLSFPRRLNPPTETPPLGGWK